MAKQLFGTDGIRGVANEYPLDKRTVAAIGAALGQWAVRHDGSAEVVIGTDTRESGPWIADQLAGGLASVGAVPRFVGTITTPGIAYLARTEDFVIGIMISASHNEYRDNGIKVFGHTGYKLPDNEEDALEQEILRLLSGRRETEPLAQTTDGSLSGRYLEFLVSTSPSLEGFSIVADCANGAAHEVAPLLFERLGAKLEPVACAPDGRNINRDCGALHPESLRTRVLDAGAHLGVAFDGDADRAIFVSHSGQIINGDAVLLLCSRWLRERGRLGGGNDVPLVVATVMSNLGLEKALSSNGIRMVRTPVGDKYVLEEMLHSDALLGGEQSGHVIFRDYATTGDGLLTALRVLEVMKETGQNLDELTADLKVFPQRLVNVRVKTKRPLEELDSVQQEMQAAQKAFRDSGRIVVRFSGTEPLARVMVEAEDSSQVDLFSERIAAAIRAELA